MIFFVAVVWLILINLAGKRYKQKRFITHDTLHGYRTVFDSSNPAEEIYVNSQIPEEEEQLDHINHLCSGIQWFLQKHKGIRKANLDSYLSWYEIMHNENPSLEKFGTIVLRSLSHNETLRSSINVYFQFL